MNQHIRVLPVIGLVLLAFTAFMPGMALATNCHDGAHAEGEANGDTSHSEHGGKHFRMTEINGHEVSYELIDMREKVKDMPGMTDTHHLMVYVKDGAGAPVTAAKTGYMITGPDGKVQKKMAMGMGGGYGADINLSQPGAYTIKTKMAGGDVQIMDEFTHEMAAQ